MNVTGESGDRLRDYRGKRHFDATAEPRGDGGRTGSAPCFVVQIHQAGACTSTSGWRSAAY